MQPVCLIPGFFPEIPDGAVPRLPSLETVLARGTLAFDRPGTLLEAWPVAEEGSSFARNLAHEAGLAEQSPFWLCADPIHLHVEGDALLLLERYSFKLGEPESSALLDTLNRHFAGEGMKFHALSPDAWLVGLDAPPRVVTTHPLTRVGRNIDGYLPGGEAGRHWRGVFNEVQMLLHEHPVNQARSARRERVISGVWFWDTPASLHEFRVVDTLRSPSAYGDAAGWVEAARSLDRDIILPMLDRLRAGELSDFTLVALEGRCPARIRVTRRNLWRIWRPLRPLVSYPGVPSLEHA